VQKEWAKADQIRIHLETMGVTLKDGPAGTNWTIE
jgi:cysteinyl-tRNA synthetase